MKNLTFLFFLLIFLFSCKVPITEKFEKDIQIIPRPQELTVLDGTFELNSKTSIKAGRNLILHAEQLREYLSKPSGYELLINKKNVGGNTIELKLSDELSFLGEEGYNMKITKTKVLITAYTAKGVFWGIQTLRQLFPTDILREAVVDDVKWIIPCIELVDVPRFEWRGLMIDYSRTFWNKNHTKKYIDALSYYKINKLHMHLTDDQGWRIEINKYPELTEIASKFDTVYNEPKEREGYYSRKDIQELVRYAKDRNIEIIPEIEMPGHTSEVFAVYPELSCTGEKLIIHPFFEGPSIHKEIFCAGKEETFNFLENVLSEIIEMFPSEYIHIGGDEAPKELWKECPDCQRVMKEKGYKDEDELQAWFIRRIEEYLNSKGKKLIGWNEIIKGGLSKTATVMYWRSKDQDEVVKALVNGNDVIMTPNTHCYFDYTYQRISTEHVYSFEPASGSFENANILGVQANFWSHIDRTEPSMDRQIFPRMLAMAEVGWTGRNNRNWENFSSRLKNHFESLDLMGIYYWDN